MNQCYNKICPFIKFEYGNKTDCPCIVCPNRVHEEYNVVVSDHILSNDELRSISIKYET